MKDDVPFFVPFDGSAIPKTAVVGGEYKGGRIYVGRAEHQGSMTPGMVLENQKKLMLPWGCHSNTKTANFEILCCEGTPQWAVASNGNVPQNAFKAGNSEFQREPLYIGRFKHDDGSLVCGKIHPSHRVCYVAYEEQELNSGNESYEVLVI